MCQNTKKLEKQTFAPIFFAALLIARGARRGLKKFFFAYIYLFIFMRRRRRWRCVHARCIIADRGGAARRGTLAPRRA